eukprot:gnl/TRDRNA2_/TRDRNA2_174072_c0_seq8.p1 gnl/TRDRNA2_/TRDRNA2_174072_c0~~gnl/TRDRNA2_/TRDRNA2_174072_c0_seq8.p1  ORF type:complete len:300 (+),score=28.81 gnl/TRDRNA2_/TRDRNA2_174072_c0_seq8:41-940(+)
MTLSCTLCAASVLWFNVASLRVQPPTKLKSLAYLPVRHRDLQFAGERLQQHPVRVSNWSLSPLPTILYGIETCSLPDHVAMVKTQLATWATNISRDHLIIVGGPYDDAAMGLSRVPMSCQDSKFDVTCKEGLVYARGIERARQLDFDWLMVGEDDKYVWPREWQEAMQGYDSQVSQVVPGSFGCSISHVADHKKEFKRPCKAKEQEGICGGMRFLVSRGALDVLAKGTNASAARLLEQINSYDIYSGACDISSTCLFTDYGIKVPKWMRSADVNSFFAAEAIYSLLSQINGSSNFTTQL